MVMVAPMVVLRKLRTLRSLGLDGTRLAMEALLLTVFVPASFSVFGVPRTERYLRRWALSRKTGYPPASLGAGAVIKVVLRSQNIVRRNTGIAGSCLTRSFTLWTLLLRRGIRTDLRVGFRKCEGTVEGHAWIEYDGLPLNEDPKAILTYSASEKATSFEAKN